MKISIVSIENYKWLALTPIELSTCPTSYILAIIEEKGERRIYILPKSFIWV